MSKVLRNWDGNLFAPELFFVKETADNTTTTLTGTSGISAYDTQLVMSADAYANNMERIPAGVGLCDYDGNLVSVGEYDIQTLARVSKQGEPEVFNAATVAALRRYGEDASLRQAVVERNDRYLRDHEDGVSQARDLLSRVGALGRTDPHPSHEPRRA